MSRRATCATFWCPKVSAVLATAGELKSLEARRSQIAKAQEKARTEAEALASRLAAVSLVFQVRVGEQNRLYGSITSKDIADELARTAEITIDRRDIDLPDALKTLGTSHGSGAAGPRREGGY